MKEVTVNSNNIMRNMKENINITINENEMKVVNEI